MTWGYDKQRMADLKQAQQSYADPANQRLQYIAQGGSPSPFASPWLALQQNYADYMQLQPAERAATGAADSRLIGSPNSQARDLKWDQAVKQAQALQGTGKSPKPFIP